MNPILELNKKVVPVTITEATFYNPMFSYLDPEGKRCKGELTICYGPTGVMINDAMMMRYLEEFVNVKGTPEEIVQTIAAALEEALRPKDLEVILGQCLHNNYSTAVKYERYEDED